MKVKIAFIMMIAVAVFVAAESNDSDSAASTSDTSTWERPLHKVDGLLQEGLTEESHRALADSFSDSTGFLRGVGDGVSERLRRASD